MMKALTTKRDYGKVQLRLKELLDERGIKRGTLAGCIGTRFEVVDHWYSGNIEKMDMDVLARICCVLECEVSDILVYQPGEET